MAIYIERDILSNFSGDIQVSSNGDIALANSLDTYKNACNFVLRTDFGDYQADGDVGCNLGSFIGEPNVQRVHDAMEYNINKVLRNEIFAPSDAIATVVPFDLEEALAIIQIAGQFMINEELITVEDDRISYSFPYIDAHPTPLTI